VPPAGLINGAVGCGKKCAPRGAVRSACEELVDCL
jgi:hypothetical protein